MSPKNILFNILFHSPFFKGNFLKKVSLNLQKLLCLKKVFRVEKSASENFYSKNFSFSAIKSFEDAKELFQKFL